MKAAIARVISRTFLDLVQRAGWHVERVEQDRVIAKCPADGCGLRVNLRPENAVPARSAMVLKEADFYAQVGSYEDARVALRKRREELCLTQVELEEMAGFTFAHIAKAEKDDPIRHMTLANMAAWANSLGLEFVLRPMPIPPVALTQIVESRARVKARTSRNKIEARRRGQRKLPKRV